MRAIISYIFIIAGLAVLWMSTSKSAMQYISDKRDNETWWGTYQGLNGDLVSMSYLDFVTKFRRKKDYRQNKATYDGKKNTVLYIHGDSYSRRLGDSSFAGVCQLKLIDRNHGLNYHLDSTKRNILIFEITERYTRNYFGTLKIFDQLCDSVIKRKNIAYNTTTYAGAMQASALPNIGIDDFFNKYINQNLQCNLFNYNFIMPMFESKAALNYYVFNRASGDVVISQDKQFLFLKQTTVDYGTESASVPVSDEEIDQLVDNFNAIYDHYRQNGFDEVFLSIIPNPITVLEPRGYNQLIPRIQHSPRLRMKIIDAYSMLQGKGETAFYRGDTHWNREGRQIWLDSINHIVTNIYNSNDLKHTLHAP